MDPAQIATASEPSAPALPESGFAELLPAGHAGCPARHPEQLQALRSR